MDHGKTDEKDISPAITRHARMLERELEKLRSDVRQLREKVHLLSEGSDPW